MKTVKILMVNDKGKHYREVEGEEVIFDGFEDYTFYLHRTPEIDYGWRVSEAYTGMYISADLYKNNALKEARKKLELHGLDRIRQAVDDGLEMLYGMPFVEDNIMVGV